MSRITQAETLETEVQQCMDALAEAVRNAPVASDGAWGYALLQMAAQIEHSGHWRAFIREALAEVIAFYEGHN
jgi:hypothetical protein